VITFGLTAQAEIRSDPEAVTSVWDEEGFRTAFLAETPWGRFPLAISLTGRHNVHNALAAVAVAGTLGIAPEAITAGLARVRPVAGRLQPCAGKGGLRLIDDTYNANPDSVGAAVEVLAALSGRRWLVLGDLAELGPQSGELHRAVGEMARRAGLDHLVGVGPQSQLAAGAFGAGGMSFVDREEMLAALRGRFGAGDLVLVKGSRSAGMEQVVQALTAEAEG
jgi:UDP-N-acetylmuramoyl-tripeptide--D-alanyl-D-alanine ligase